MGLNPVSSSVERALGEAIRAASDCVRQFDPQLVVLIAPDHYNGFFNQLMPTFCLGTEAQSLGDYGTPSGKINVDSECALGLAQHLVSNAFDIAVSRRMTVDHGFAQPLELLWGGLDTPPVIPIFLNAVAPPSIPSTRRCVELGRRIGEFLSTTGLRTLTIGSGGLSHEPPIPTMTHADPAIRERTIVPRTQTAAEHEERVRRVMAAGVALAQGTSPLKPLNPIWDRAWMSALETEDGLERIAAMSDSSISADAGLAAHESKTWVVARATLNAEASRRASFTYYQDIPEYIAGFGIMFKDQA